MEDKEITSREEGSEASVQDIIGLIPAGGRASRIAPLPCSREIFPVGLWQPPDKAQPRPKAACLYVLETMRSAGILKAYIVLRNGKWDIPSYLGSGAMIDMHLAYLIMRLPLGVPYTLDQAYPFVRHAVVALGFPDILFDAKDAFARLLDRQTSRRSDVVLGLFPSGRPEKVDMVNLDAEGRVRGFVIKPCETELRYTWGIAVWTPPFTRFMHERVLSLQESSPARPELYVGDVFQAALDAGMLVDAVQVSDRPYLDIGTPEDLARAIQSFGIQHA